MDVIVLGWAFHTAINNAKSPFVFFPFSFLYIYIYKKKKLLNFISFTLFFLLNAPFNRYCSSLFQLLYAGKSCKDGSCWLLLVCTLPSFFRFLSLFLVGSYY